MNPLAMASDETVSSEAVDSPALRLQTLPLPLPNQMLASPTSALAIFVESGIHSQHSGSRFSFRQIPNQPELRDRLGLIPAGQWRERNSR